MFDWIGQFFKELFNLIPKIVYLLYTSLASLIDLLQLLFRKLAGLDVYYVDGEPVGGDIVTNFIQGILGIDAGYGGSEYVDKTNYSALSTVFWAFVIFGLVVCFVSTLIAIVKSHYSYNEKSAKGPMPIVAAAGKAVINMVAVPVIIVLGLWLSQAILTALDAITSTTSSDIISIYGDDKQDLLKPVQYKQNGETEETYLYYDMFGYTAQIQYGDLVLDIADIAQPDEEDMARVAARSQTYSGTIFKVAAYNANRIRTGMYVGDNNTIKPNVSGFEPSNSGGQLSLFGNYETIDEAAEMVDTAFANFLHLNDTYSCSYSTDGFLGIDKDRYFTQFTTKYYSSFSKFNIGLVWYYYDLWSFNFIVGFGAAIVCSVLFFNLILGLMTRFFMCLVLFFVMPPLAGLAPLDNGKAFGTWRETFMKQVLMAYGAVVGMNLVMILLPFVYNIDFFNIKIADLFVQTMFIIVGLITIKTAISTLSALIGAEDANAVGDKINKEVGAVAGKALAMTAGAAGVAGKAFMKATPIGIGLQGVGFLAGKAAGGIGAGVKKYIEKDPARKAKFANAQAKAKKFAGQAHALLKGGFGGLDAYNIQNRMRNAKATAEVNLDEAENDILQGSKADLLNKVNGGKFSNSDVRNMAHAVGISDTETEALVRSVRRDRSGRIRADATLGALAASGEDKKFESFYNRNSGNMSNMLSSYSAADTRAKKLRTDIGEYKDTISRQEIREARAYERGTVGTNVFTAAADIGKQFMANFKTGITQNDGINEFMENSTKGIKAALGVKDKPKADEITAKNTGELGEKFDALNKTLTELTNEMRSDRHKGP